MGKLLIGCIADDFTGAGDAASFLAKGGLKTVLYNELPDRIQEPAPQAVVIALKTRTAPVHEAVEKSLQAIRRLKAAGAEHIYIKYCSTFDSTKKGNIGPVCDAAMEELGVPYTLLCPSLPVNGRTVKDGRLYVKGVPLHESSMKDHPLTPMWDDRISVLMREQSRYPVYSLPVDEPLTEGEMRKRDPHGTQAEHRYIVPDYYEDKHGEQIAARFGSLPLLTGGSGLLEPLAKYLMKESGETGEGIHPDPPSGPGLLLAGSCSTATLGQIEAWENSGKASIKVLPEAVLTGTQTLEALTRTLEEHENEDVLIYSSAPAKEVRSAQKQGSERVSEALEALMAGLGRWAVQHGRSRLIVAGGETSGAVTKGLGYRSFQIGESVAPGVPILIPREQTGIRLVLKSGNFGDRDFFRKALELTEKAI